MAVLSKPLLGVRAAETDDDQFVLELAAEAFREYDPSSSLTTLRMLREPNAKTLIATRDVAPVGFAILDPRSQRSWAINAIAVAPAERGKGVGQRLMREAEHQARTRGVACLTLCTAQANLAALDLFLRLGFVITDRHAVRYWGRQPACLLEKRLA